MERLNKYLASCGVASRRKSDILIQRGKVKVNDMLVTEPGSKIDPENDLVYFEDRLIISSSNAVYIMLNKPCGCVSTVRDQFGRKTVLNYVKGVNARIFPVGRLDYDTSGLILLTNDGTITYKLTHPRHRIRKVYLALLQGVPNNAALKTFREGIKIEEDFKTAPAEIEIKRVIDGNAEVEITIKEGKKRQIRKMCKEIGYHVQKLRRIAVGNLSLDDLPMGKWRYLTDKEIEYLNKL